MLFLRTKSQIYFLWDNVSLGFNLAFLSFRQVVLDHVNPFQGYIQEQKVVSSKKK